MKFRLSVGHQVPPPLPLPSIGTVCVREFAGTYVDYVAVFQHFSLPLRYVMCGLLGWCHEDLAGKNEKKSVP